MISLSLSFSLSHTHTHFASITVYTPSSLWNPAVSMVTPAHALCQIVHIYLSTAQFLSSEAKQPITDGFKLSVHRIICPFKCRFLCPILGVSILVGQSCGLRATYSTNSPCDLDTCTANCTPVGWLGQRGFTERRQEYFIASARQK